MRLLFEENEVEFDEIPVPCENGKSVTLYMARLDKLHPVVSGNKLYKLHYFIERALKSKKKIITYGGAYSNHLAATAYACNTCGLESIGIIRGEEPAILSHTLQFCKEQNMQLIFISREEYKKQTSEFTDVSAQWGSAVIIPEGGYHPDGAKGASIIFDRISHLSPTHVCTAVGTATTLAGLLMKSISTEIIGIPVIKNMTDISERLKFTGVHSDLKFLNMFHEYHFGGYAKHTEKLTDFLNMFYNKYKIPLDFVYTGKMMYAVIEKINEGYFAAGSRIVCLHTGGLQGNNSLKKGVLVY